MGNWKTRFIDLGECSVGKKKVIIFDSLIKLQNILDIGSSCGCAQPKYDIDSKKLVVIYNPGKVPIHLVDIGYYTTTKSITITYSDGESEILSFKAKVSK